MENVLAIVISQNGADNLWVYDPARETLTQVSFGPEAAGYPVWTPDGEFLAFFMGTLAWARADGSSGAVERFEVGPARTFPMSISGDGKRLVFFDPTGIRTLRVEQTRAKMQLSQAESLLQNGSAPTLSPDGRFMAYVSSGQVYVRPFGSAGQREGAAPTGRWPVSNDGGNWPVWPRGGTDIFYVADRRIHVTSYTVSGASFTPGRQRVWSDRRLADVGANPSFDMEPGGKRAVVLLNAGEEPKPETHVRVLLNLGDELLRRTAAEKKR